MFREQQLFKAVAVLGALYGRAVGAYELHAALHQRLGQVDGGLAAQRGDDPQGVLELNDVHDVLNGQRLEIEFVAGGVVGGDRLGVVVDDYGLVAMLADGLDRVDGGVVELHALAYADGSRAEHDNLGPVGDYALVLLLVGGVEVGDVALKLAGAGVYHLVDGPHAELAALFRHVLLRALPEVRKVPVGKAHALGAQEVFARDGFVLYLALELDDVVYLVEEEHVDARDVADAVVVHAEPHELGNGEDAVVRAVLDVVEQLVDGHVVEFGQVEVVRAYLKRAHGLQQALLNRAAHGHDLAGGLHLRTELVARARKLVEGEAGHFCDDVVERRLEAGRGCSQA